MLMVGKRMMNIILIYVWKILNHLILTYPNFHTKEVAFEFLCLFCHIEASHNAAKFLKSMAKVYPLPHF